MQKLNPRSSDEDSFKYSILISLHYYDINFHPERMSKLKLCENKYNFIHITLNELEINNPNISLTVFYKNNKILYTSKNNSPNKAQIVKLKDEFIKLNNLLTSFSHIELREHMLQNIFKSKIDEAEIKNINN